MRRRIVSSTNECFAAPLSEEALKTLSSEGMKTAASFAAQFTVAAQFPVVTVFKSGTPHENGHLFCDTPARKDLFKCIESASVISVELGMINDQCDGRDRTDPILVVCAITFKRGGEAFAWRTYFFERSSGICITYSQRGF